MKKLIHTVEHNGGNRFTEDQSGILVRSFEMLHSFDELKALYTTAAPEAYTVDQTGVTINGIDLAFLCRDMLIYYEGRFRIPNEGSVPIGKEYLTDNEWANKWKKYWVYDADHQTITSEEFNIPTNVDTKLVPLFLSNPFEVVDLLSTEIDTTRLGYNTANADISFNVSFQSNSRKQTSQVVSVSYSNAQAKALILSYMQCILTWLFKYDYSITAYSLYNNTFLEIKADSYDSNIIALFFKCLDVFYNAGDYRNRPFLMFRKDSSSYSEDEITNKITLKDLIIYSLPLLINTLSKPDSTDIKCFIPISSTTNVTDNNRYIPVTFPGQILEQNNLVDAFDEIGANNRKEGVSYTAKGVLTTAGGLYVVDMTKKEPTEEPKQISEFLNDVVPKDATLEEKRDLSVDADVQYSIRLPENIFIDDSTSRVAQISTRGKHSFTATSFLNSEEIKRTLSSQPAGSNTTVKDFFGPWNYADNEMSGYTTNDGGCDVGINLNYSEGASNYLVTIGTNNYIKNYNKWIDGWFNDYWNKGPMAGRMELIVNNRYLTIAQLYSYLHGPATANFYAGIRKAVLNNGRIRVYGFIRIQKIGFKNYNYPTLPSYKASAPSQAGAGDGATNTTKIVNLLMNIDGTANAETLTPLYGTYHVSTSSYDNNYAFIKENVNSGELINYYVRDFEVNDAALVSLPTTNEFRIIADWLHNNMGASVSKDLYGVSTPTFVYSNGEIKFSWVISPSRQSSDLTPVESLDYNYYHFGGAAACVAEEYSIPYYTAHTLKRPYNFNMSDVLSNYYLYDTLDFNSTNFRVALSKTISLNVFMDIAVTDAAVNYYQNIKVGMSYSNSQRTYTSYRLIPNNVGYSNVTVDDAGSSASTSSGRSITIEDMLFNSCSSAATRCTTKRSPRLNFTIRSNTHFTYNSTVTQPLDLSFDRRSLATQSIASMANQQADELPDKYKSCYTSVMKLIKLDDYASGTKMVESLNTLISSYSGIYDILPITNVGNVQVGICINARGKGSYNESPYLRDTRVTAVLGCDINGNHQCGRYYVEQDAFDNHTPSALSNDVQECITSLLSNNYDPYHHNTNINKNFSVNRELSGVLYDWKNDDWKNIKYYFIARSFKHFYELDNLLDELAINDIWDSNNRSLYELKTSSDAANILLLNSTCSIYSSIKDIFTRSKNLTVRTCTNILQSVCGISAMVKTRIATSHKYTKESLMNSYNLPTSMPSNLTADRIKVLIDNNINAANDAASELSFTPVITDCQYKLKDIYMTADGTLTDSAVDIITKSIALENPVVLDDLLEVDDKLYAQIDTTMRDSLNDRLSAISTPTLAINVKDYFNAYENDSRPVDSLPEFSDAAQLFDSIITPAESTTVQVLYLDDDELAQLIADDHLWGDIASHEITLVDTIDNYNEVLVEYSTSAMANNKIINWCNVNASKLSLYGWSDSLLNQFPNHTILEKAINHFDQVEQLQLDSAATSSVEVPKIDKLKLFTLSLLPDRCIDLAVSLPQVDVNPDVNLDSPTLPKFTSAEERFTAIKTILSTESGDVLALDFNKPSIAVSKYVKFNFKMGSFSSNPDENFNSETTVLLDGSTVTYNGVTFSGLRSNGENNWVQFPAGATITFTAQDSHMFIALYNNDAHYTIHNNGIDITNSYDLVENGLKREYTLVSGSVSIISNGMTYIGVLHFDYDGCPMNNYQQQLVSPVEINIDELANVYSTSIDAISDSIKESKAAYEDVVAGYADTATLVLTSYYNSVVEDAVNLYEDGKQNDYTDNGGNDIEANRSSEAITSDMEMVDVYTEEVTTQLDQFIEEANYIADDFKDIIRTVKANVKSYASSIKATIASSQVYQGLSSTITTFIDNLRASASNAKSFLKTLSTKMIDTASGFTSHSWADSDDSSYSGHSDLDIFYSLRSKTLQATKMLVYTTLVAANEIVNTAGNSLRSFVKSTIYDGQSVSYRLSGYETVDIPAYSKVFTISEFQNHLPNLWVNVVSKYHMIYHDLFTLCIDYAHMFYFITLDPENDLVTVRLSPKLYSVTPDEFNRNDYGLFKRIRESFQNNIATINYVNGKVITILDTALTNGDIVELYTGSLITSVDPTIYSQSYEKYNVYAPQMNDDAVDALINKTPFTVHSATADSIMNWALVGVGLGAYIASTGFGAKVGGVIAGVSAIVGLTADIFGRVTGDRLSEMIASNKVDKAYLNAMISNESLVTLLQMYPTECGDIMSNQIDAFSARELVHSGDGNFSPSGRFICVGFSRGNAKLAIHIRTDYEMTLYRYLKIAAGLSIGAIGISKVLSSTAAMRLSYKQQKYERLQWKADKLWSGKDYDKNMKRITKKLHRTSNKLDAIGSDSGNTTTIYHDSSENDLMIPTLATNMMTIATSSPNSLGKGSLATPKVLYNKKFADTNTNITQVGNEIADNISNGNTSVKEYITGSVYDSLSQEAQHIIDAIDLIDPRTDLNHVLTDLDSVKGDVLNLKTQLESTKTTISTDISNGKAALLTAIETAEQNIDLNIDTSIDKVDAISTDVQSAVAELQIVSRDLATVTTAVAVLEGLSLYIEWSKTHVSNVESSLADLNVKDLLVRYYLSKGLSQDEASHMADFRLQSDNSQFSY